MDTPVTTEVLSGEARFILQHLARNAAEGDSNHMGDVRTALEGAVTLDFADYLKFLKKFNYITLNRQEHTLGLTTDGSRIVEGLDIERFTLEIGDYFEHRVQEPKVIVNTDDDRGNETRVALTAASDLRYVRYDELGSGALGTVLRGKHGKLGIDVAIKEIKDLFDYFSFLKRQTVASRLDVAVRAQAALHHPTVLRIFDLEIEVAHPYYVMEICPSSLRQRLEENPEGLPEEEALRWFLQVLYALKAAHDAGILHRGLKPENVLLDELDNARVGDFGISTLISAEDAKGQSMPRVFLGTGGMAYLAPEQMELGAELSPATDIYAAGMLLYELLIGRAPGRRAPLPSEAKKGVSKKLDDLFDKLTQDRPEDRYADVDAVLADFYAAFDGFGKPGDLLLRGSAPAEAAQGDEAKEAGGAKKKAAGQRAGGKKKGDSEAKNGKAEEEAPEESEAAADAEA
ncbi:MAG: serine/threonine-protein kinase [Deltaproteobacteria bacterium]|nr:serine/threonine-protein kinase [Deltaproteobacteria bacterium]